MMTGLNNSTGCRVMPNSENHRLAPFISAPMPGINSKVITSIPAASMGSTAACHQLMSIRDMHHISPRPNGM